MTTIYKYGLQITDEQQVTIPGLKHFLHVAMQDGKLCVWAEVDPEGDELAYTFHVYGTGNPISLKHRQRIYIGTFLERSFVWHVFVRI